MSKAAPDINPRFLRLLKTAKKAPKKAAKEEDLFSVSTSSPTLTEEKPEVVERTQVEANFLLEADNNEPIQRWIRSKSPDAENPEAINLFNIINRTGDPEAPLAEQLTLTVLKGTSFEDKREVCGEVCRNIRIGDHTGRILLVPSPYIDDNNPERSDPYALKAVAEGYPISKFLGYIPKAQQINKAFLLGLQNGRFCGCHIADAKQTAFKGEDNVIITIITGWTKA